MNGGQEWWNITAPVFLSIVAVVIFSSDWLTELCQYDRNGLEKGELWRLISGNFAHWSGEHLFWDLLVFAFLGMIVSIRDKLHFPILLILSSIAISSSVYFIHPSMQLYRGLSGIDSALFTYFAISFIYSSLKKNNYYIAITGMSLMLILAAKTIFEINSGTNLFVSSVNFVPVVTTHIAGISSGVLVFLLGPFLMTGKTCYEPFEKEAKK